MRYLMSGMSETAKPGRRMEDKRGLLRKLSYSAIELRRWRVGAWLTATWFSAGYDPAEAGQLGHGPASVVLLLRPTLDFIPIGVFG